MKKISIIFLLLTLLAPLAFSQSKSEDTKVGIQINALLPIDEYPSGTRYIKTSYLGRIFVRFGVSEYFNLEAGAGYGAYAGLGFNHEYYKTDIAPFDVRAIYKLMNEDSYPYIFAGLGGMYYKVKTFPTTPSVKEVKKNGGAGILPVGIGYKLALGESADIDFNVGVTVTTTDNLNYYKNGKPPDCYYFAGVGLLFGGGPKDIDNDGLTNDEEEQLGTDPRNPDTDGDGLTDGQEVKLYHTDPLKADTDGDGLSDYDEIMKYHTDPLKADTDGDGLNDGDEVMKYKTDPLKADTDGDGLNDGDEVMKYRTDPLKVDTDGDGLSDYNEIMKYHTDPLNADTDGDGLKDGEEVMKYKTDPLKADTDGGSVNDGVEVRRGTDPLNPDDDVIKVGQAIVLEGITFETNKAVIKP
ncbi:MAG: binary toxin-like calcium binding domain-containing protein, partial [Bacteroidota bacterium]|nr:binary toxin-like calcium binding domain-containing protein [Bacteroidota bacterium]